MNEQNTLIEKLEKKSTQYIQYKKNAKTLHDVRYFGGNANGLTEAISIIKEHNDWSSVDNSLPSENEIVLVYKRGFGVMGIAKYSANVFWYFDLNGNKHSFKFMSGVTHYKSLPSPPSEV